ncbi:Uncultured bacterium genome assembly Metasoil_fosmids_resub OS=uncultured bacterium PE=4 SV=1: DUF3987 [Gemmata massiliana]|uniref:DUF3987 domain-containing protein n=1 Tax=Gemmata massiliana TaxID=1210884 RepID=A0A6P2CU58_9BACT|nr:Uncultured bacterium genome assembly Metasoil_fosmids_resub OS=uncultured bacterium PE=4 SV=1: DUF3987 [Gemmata massiliana]VTR92499.1 Uncultured bacterium genome assembly Metasoil_fosmids_resub OS=uncultured bacterium PE=4 SV=1: DUF3987 [Gemmata massiliana]
MQAAHLKAHRAEAHRAELRDYERQKRRSKDDDPGGPPEPPVCTRIYSRDTTIEALGGLLVDNRTRFLVGRDELSGWLTSFNQYKAKGGSDLVNWLELHGLGTLCVNRKTGEPRTTFVPDVGVSLCGGIQPGVLRLALTPQHFSAGVPARLLFAYPPRRPKEWTEDDIDANAEAGYHRLVKELAELEPGADADGNSYPVALGLAPDAKAEWVRFYARFALKQSETEGELAAAFSKLEGYAARLALVHHVCQAAGSGAREPVGLASVRAGIALAEWFTAEAERVYQMLGEEAGEQEARKLVEVVGGLAARHGGRLTARHLQKSNNRKYRTSGAAEAALESLVALGLGRWEDGPVPQHGGHRVRFFVPCTPHDTSDTRPAPDGPGAPERGTEPHDTRPDAPAEPPGDATGSADASADPARTCGPGAPPGAGRVSEVSCGVQVHEEQNEPAPPVVGATPECRAAEVPSVVRPGEPDAHALVRNAAGLAHLVALIKGEVGPVGLDLETTGLNPVRDRVRSCHWPPRSARSSSTCSRSMPPRPHWPHCSRSWPRRSSSGTTSSPSTSRSWPGSGSRWPACSTPRWLPVSFMPASAPITISPRSSSGR